MFNTVVEFTRWLRTNKINLAKIMISINQSSIYYIIDGFEKIHEESIDGVYAFILSKIKQGEYILGRSGNIDFNVNIDSIEWRINITKSLQNIHYYEVTVFAV